MAEDARFPVLTSAIIATTGADGVVFDPPYVYVVKGTEALRYWMPETLEGDVSTPGLYTLRAVPPNGRLVDVDDAAS